MAIIGRVSTRTRVNIDDYKGALTRVVDDDEPGAIDPYAEESCDHVNERETAGGWIDCDDCGSHAKKRDGA